MFKKSNKKKYRVPFELISNQIIIKLKVNDSKKLNFILDTGTKYTMLTSFPKDFNFKYKISKQVTIRGFGNSYQHLTAFVTKDNKISIGNKVFFYNSTILIFTDYLQQFSERLGEEIHGIIGYDLFKDLIIKIDYSKLKLTFYNPKYFIKKKFDSYEKLKLDFFNKKPFINAKASFHPEEEMINLKLVFDTGNGDALWLFENSNSKIKVHNKFLESHLGWGLNGEIFGKRSKIPKFHLGKYRFENPTISFPDSSFISFALKYKDRNGSIGGGILRRFHLILNYKEKYVLLKANQFLKDPFYYNMSGMELRKYSTYLPIYIVFHIRQNSPAFNAGIRKGDIIFSINNVRLIKETYLNYNEQFRRKPGKIFHVIFFRNGVKMKTKFKLEKVI